VKAINSAIEEKKKAPLDEKEPEKEKKKEKKPLASSTS